ncbi:hypothetical protein [Clostridium sp.]|uniref:hypothetical protein n=1 Tax=Clostridium sp. TaxID=1506 RepID=UPI002FCB7EF6
MKKSFFTTKSKFFQALALSFCLIFVSSNTAFASDDTTKVLTAQNEITTTNQVLLEKQNEIDKYVFEDHSKEIADKGIQITHTGQVNNYVEVGITPYTKENADYLYNIFGTDKVKIVEGVKAQLMNESSTTTVAVDANQATSSKLNPIIFSLAGLIGVGAISLIIYRKKVIK